MLLGTYLNHILYKKQEFDNSNDTYDSDSDATSSESIASNLRI